MRYGVRGTTISGFAIALTDLVVEQSGQTLGTYTPTGTDTITVRLLGAQNAEFTPTYSGSTLYVGRWTPVANGEYAVEVLIRQQGGLRLRSLKRSEICIVEAAADVPTGAELINDTSVVTMDTFVFVRGEDGADGTDGADGKSAYEIAVENGFTGTEQEWLASLEATIVVDLDSPTAQMYTDVADAIGDGKMVVGKKGSSVLPLAYYDSLTQQFQFANDVLGTAMAVSLASDGTVSQSTVNLLTLPSCYIANLDSPTADIFNAASTAFSMGKVVIGTYQDNFIPLIYEGDSSMTFGLACNGYSLLVNFASDGTVDVHEQNLATVATSGSYNDLTDKPTIPAAQIQSDWSQSDTTAKDYIKNKPTIPAVVNSLNSSATDKALSAAQGKALNENITQLGQEMGIFADGRIEAGTTLFTDSDVEQGKNVYIKVTRVQSGTPSFQFFDANDVALESYSMQAGAIGDSQSWMLTLPTGFKYAKTRWQPADYYVDSFKQPVWKELEDINGELSAINADFGVIYDGPTTAPAVLFTSADVSVGDVVYVRAKHTDTGSASFQLFDANDAVIASFNGTSKPSGSETSFMFQVPSDFSYAKTRWQSFDYFVLNIFRGTDYFSKYAEKTEVNYQKHIVATYGLDIAETATTITLSGATNFFTWKVFDNSFSSYWVTSDATFTKSSNLTIVLDTTDNTYKSRANNAVLTTDLLLLYCNGQNLITGGLIYAYYIDYMADMRNKSLDKGESLVPTYYADYMADKAVEIRDSQIFQTGISDTFIFLTDPHWGVNMQNSIALVNYMMERGLTQKMVFGGDVCSAESPADKPWVQKSEIQVQMLLNGISRKSGRIYNVRGNHDFNGSKNTIASGAGSDIYTWNEKVTRYLLTSPMYNDKDVVLADGDATYYYFDDERSKIRYIVTYAIYSANFDSTQEDWLLNTLTNLPAGYDVVLFNHDGIAKTTSFNAWTSCPDLPQIMFAFNNKQSGTTATHSKAYNFTAATGKLLAVVSGHTHADLQTFVGDVTCISTRSDMRSGGKGAYLGGAANSRTSYTTDEQAIDHITIDKAAGISCIRIGAGENRRFHSEIVNISVAGTTALTPTLSGTLTWGSYNNDTDWYSGDFNTPATPTNTRVSVSNGTVTGVASGQAVIYANDEDGNREFFNIVVTS